MIRALIVVFCYFWIGSSHLSGQIVVDSVSSDLSLISNKNVEVLVRSSEISFEKIQKKRGWKAHASDSFSSVASSVWFRFEIENTRADTAHVYLFSMDDFVTVYKENNKDFATLRNGYFLPVSQRTNQLEHFFTKLTCLPFEKSLVYIELKNKNIKSYSYQPALYSEGAYWKFTSINYRSQENSIVFIYFYIISILTIFLFTLVIWLHLVKKLYLYYLGYLFFQLVYGFLVFRYTIAPVGNLFKHAPAFADVVFDATQFLFIGFYIVFIIQLLKIEVYDKLLLKILNYLALLCFLYAVVSFCLRYFTHQPEADRMLVVGIRILILPANLILFFWIINKVKHPLLLYFVIGQGLFFVGSFLSVYKTFTPTIYVPNYLANLPVNPNIIFQLGLLAEVFCFSMALGRNILLIQKEKEKDKIKLIQQLQENQYLQENMNRELDLKVHEKTDELIQLYSEMERERAIKTRDDFNKKIRETEMMALRSQMNPHFIFNSMNAIKNLMMHSRNEDAITYLDDFSSLLRGILQNSSREKITVEEELEILELYLSLEKSRMGIDFSYEINCTSKEELSQYEIPPLLLQPIVENAIWHGLHPSLKAQKKLLITFDTTANLRISIEDNGVGRKASAANKKMHQSMGTRIVEERLTLFNYLNDHKIRIQVEDLEDDFQILGTKFILTYTF